MVQREESEAEAESSEDDAFLGTVGQGQGSTDLWVTKGRINGIFMEFQIDTGAELSSPSKTLRDLENSPCHRLRGPYEDQTKAYYQ